MIFSCNSANFFSISSFCFDEVYAQIPATIATAAPIPATTQPGPGIAADVAATTPAPSATATDIAAADVAMQYAGTPTATAPATPDAIALSTTLFFSNSTPAAFPSSPIAIVIFVISASKVAISSGSFSSMEAIFLSNSFISSSIFSNIAIRSSSELSSVNLDNPVELA